MNPTKLISQPGPRRLPSFVLLSTTSRTRVQAGGDKDLRFFYFVSNGFLSKVFPVCLRDDEAIGCPGDSPLWLIDQRSEFPG